MSDAIQNLKKAEKAINKLRNKLHRADLDYTVQISVSSVDPTKIRYAAQMTPPAEGLSPVTFIKDTPEKLIQAIKEATKHINYNEVEIAYHDSQIQACHRTIAFHQERIEKIKNPEPEQEASKTKDKKVLDTDKKV